MTAVERAAQAYIEAAERYQTAIQSDAALPHSLGQLHAETMTAYETLRLLTGTGPSEPRGILSMALGSDRPARLSPKLDLDRRALAASLAEAHQLTKRILVQLEQIGVNDGS